MVSMSSVDPAACTVRPLIHEYSGEVHPILHSSLCMLLHSGVIWDSLPVLFSGFEMVSLGWFYGRRFELCMEKI